MVKVGAATLVKYRTMAEKAMNRIKAAREKGEQVMETATKTAVVTSTAGVLGVIQGRTGGIEILKLPLDLLVGAGAHIGGFLGLAGKHSSQLHNVGDGALATYAATMGRAVGVQWKATGKLGLPPSGTIGGELPANMSGAESATDAELARAVLRR